MRLFFKRLFCKHEYIIQYKHILPELKVIACKKCDKEI